MFARKSVVAMTVAEGILGGRILHDLRSGCSARLRARPV
jgi:hypothetical protein